MALGKPASLSPSPETAESAQLFGVSDSTVVGRATEETGGQDTKTGSGASPTEPASIPGLPSPASTATARPVEGAAVPGGPRTGKWSSTTSPAEGSVLEALLSITSTSCSPPTRKSSA
ncbi:hypothetical protein AAFF_G00013190 [Aldrovandia affinis]|uniref:Uncharacterized protein n=1 Tax=Aldrovandia affinis TaxID=143900 RepID=A0AAD7VYL0_9TELE|nr:hypothetical protein AAFF_G00013190 [Aldrovandia affinis]